MIRTRTFLIETAISGKRQISCFDRIHTTTIIVLFLTHFHCQNRLNQRYDMNETFLGSYKEMIASPDVREAHFDVIEGNDGAQVH